MAEQHTTFEEAKLCPKCSMPGEDVATTPAEKDPRKTIHTIYCRNDQCTWFNTPWLVQVNPDGSVPKAYEQLGAKQFPKLSQESETRVMEAL